MASSATTSLLFKKKYVLWFSKSLRTCFIELLSSKKGIIFSMIKGLIFCSMRRFISSIEVGRQSIAWVSETKPALMFTTVSIASKVLLAPFSVVATLVIYFESRRIMILICPILLSSGYLEGVKKNNIDWTKSPLFRWNFIEPCLHLKPYLKSRSAKSFSIQTLKRDLNSFAFIITYTLCYSLSILSSVYYYRRTAPILS